MTNEEFIELWNKYKGLACYAIKRSAPHLFLTEAKEDLLQECKIALLSAVDTFDPARGKFDTHLFRKFTSAIQRARGKYQRAVNIPIQVEKCIYYLVRIRFLCGPLTDAERIEAMASPTPTPAEERLPQSIRDAVAQRRAQIRDALSPRGSIPDEILRGHHEYLTTLALSEGDPAHELIADTNETNETTETELFLFPARWRKFYSSLTDSQRAVFDRLSQGYTNAETARDLGISRQSLTFSMELIRRKLREALLFKMDLDEIF